MYKTEMRTCLGLCNTELCARLGMSQNAMCRCWSVPHAFEMLIVLEKVSFVGQVASLNSKFWKVLESEERSSLKIAIVNPLKTADPF